MEFYSLACQSGQFTSKLPTVWIQIPLLMLSDDVLLEEDKLCWWDLTMVENGGESQERVMWSCLRLESKQDSRLSSGKKHQVDFQSSCPVISWGCLGVMHSFCAEGDESSHEGRAFRWRGFADSNLWSRSDYQRLIHNQSIRWPQWSWSPHAQPPVVIAIRTSLTPWLVQQRR